MLVELIKLVGAPLLAGFVAAWLSNYFAASFSYKRFRKEQWWQAKREVYGEIIRRLAEIISDKGRYLAYQDTSGLAVPLASPKREASLSWSLHEAASAGAYIISPKTAETVAWLINHGLASNVREDVVIDPSEFYDKAANDYKAARTALEIIRAEALLDLEIED